MLTKTGGAYAYTSKEERLRETLELPYKHVFLLMPKDAQNFFFFKRADAATSTASDVVQQHDLYGWELHVCFDGANSALETYRRHGEPLSVEELAALFDAQTAGKDGVFWRRSDFTETLKSWRVAKPRKNARRQAEKRSRHSPPKRVATDIRRDSAGREKLRRLWAVHSGANNGVRTAQRLRRLQKIRRKTVGDKRGKDRSKLGGQGQEERRAGGKFKRAQGKPVRRRNAKIRRNRLRIGRRNPPHRLPVARRFLRRLASANAHKRGSHSDENSPGAPTPLSATTSKPPTASSAQSFSKRACCSFRPSSTRSLGNIWSRSTKGSPPNARKARGSPP